jgi:hypothetical protein
VPDIDGLDSSEQELAREKCDFYDEYNRKSNGELVVTQSRLIFLDDFHLHHTIDLEHIQGLYVETTGLIGAYLRVDYESPNGVSIARYKGSLVQAEYLMDRVKAAMISDGSLRTYETTRVVGSAGDPIEVPQYSRSEIDSMKGPYDDCCVCGLYCMWMEVMVLAVALLSGMSPVWPLWPGYGLMTALLSIGFVAFTIVLTFWWASIRGKKDVI